MDEVLKISIIIPCYEMDGIGANYLHELLNTISSQTYKNYEVIIPDHSKNDSIEKESKRWSDMEIIHFYNERGRGNSSINMNEGIKRASGDIIKIMHMDDYFYSNDALRYISYAYNNCPDKKWGVVGFNHLYSVHAGCEKHCKRNHELEGPIGEHIGTGGCPSVYFYIRNDEDLDLFDENLVIINDGDMHLRLQKKYGDMIVVDKICVTIRMHKHNFAKKISKSEEKLERIYLNKKHGPS